MTTAAKAGRDIESAEQDMEVLVAAVWDLSSYGCVETPLEKKILYFSN